MFKAIKTVLRPWLLPVALPIINYVNAQLTKLSRYWLQRQFNAGTSQSRYLYDEDNLTTPKNHDFVTDPRFIASIKEYLSAPFTGRDKAHHHGRWNLHVVFWAASHAIQLKADIVQLGVFEGSEAAAIAAYTNFAKSGQKMFLVDTFTGIPEGQWTHEEITAGADSAQWAYKEMGDLYQFTKQRMSRYPNIEVIQGTVPDILPSIMVDRIGLLMLDMNVALPERTAADFFWDRIVPGGLLISDDYGHSRPGAGFYGQKLAFDDFAKSKGVEVLTLPTGHGFVIKP